MSLNLTKAVAEFLQSHEGEKFTAREISLGVIQNYPAECAKKIANSKNKLKEQVSSQEQMDSLLVDILVAEIGAHRASFQNKVPQIKTTEGRPRKYYYTSQSDADEVSQTETQDLSPNSNTFKEHDLYPLLSSFLLSELGVYSKRIDERRSKNMRGAGGNRWLYPDLVGMEDLSSDWGREIKDCVQQYSDKKTKLWSFEVKILVNRSNVREVFFQTVSNSSWANFGYLVASEIEGADTLKELRMLSSLHGIGFIRLDAENPSESQILIPAKERTDIDWDTANRLTDENNDFVEYIKLIRQFYQTGEVRPVDWDAPAE